MEPYKAEALFDYEAVEETELDIKKGDIVLVEENNDSGWSLVSLGEKTGWVPFDYVEKVPDLPPNVETSPSPPPAPPPTEPVIVYEEENDPVPPPEMLPEDEPEPENKEEKTQDLNNTLNTLQSLSGDSGKICHSCGKPVSIAEPFVVAKEKTFHAHCFTCTKCGIELGGKPFVEKDGKFYCEKDYYDEFSPKCGYCQETIQGQYISALDQSWHPEHFLCAECDQPFEGNQFRKHDNKPYCEEHYKQLFASTCAKCDQAITGQVFEALDKKFHLDCFVCEKDDHPIGEGSFHFHNKKVYCPEHFEELFMQKCAGCGKVISGQYLMVLDKHYHPECWVCTLCGDKISPNNCAQYKNKFYCKGCISKARSQGLKSQTYTTSNVSNPKKVESAPVESKEEEESMPQLVYSYESLKNRDYDKSVVDSLQLEMYLADDVFEKMFGMNKAQFKKLPKWKQKAKKRNVQLF